MQRVPLHVLHVDMDAFYAAVEVLDRPELKGKPIIIGSPPNQRGVVSTASYEARAFGVHSAMPSRTAAQKCPDGIFLPVRMPRYQEVSRQVMSIFHRYTPEVEPLSIDEAFLDVSGVLWLWESAVRLARDLQQTILKELNLSASIGVAPNKFLAKLCSDMDKPAGCTVTPETVGDIERLLDPLQVGRIWGVGKKTLASLQAIGIHSVGDLQKSNADLLCAAVGKNTASHIARLARGQDSRRVEVETSAKSISGEATFSQDLTDPSAVRAALIQQVERVGRQLRQAGCHASTATLKIRFAPFETLSRQLPLNPPVSHDHGLIDAAGRLLDGVPLHQPVRLIGFGASGLREPDQPFQGTLFEEASGTGSNQKKTQLDQAADTLREQFGKDSIRHASSLPPSPKKHQSRER